MSARVSLAPSGDARPRQQLLSSSQSASSSAAAAFTFRPHVLLKSGTSGDAKALLDFADLNDRIDIFKEVFLAQIEEARSAVERGAEEHLVNLRNESRIADLTKEAIEKQRDEQKKLYQDIASERQAESSAQGRLSVLQASRDSLSTRLHHAEQERDRLRAKIEQKTSEVQNRRHRLTTEIMKNKPELQRYYEKLGCRISAGPAAGERSGSSNMSNIRFSFCLIDPDDWSFEAKFIIDASKAKYKVISHSPTIPSDKLERLIADLNSSRALFVFIRRMRAAFKEEIEAKRAAAKAVRNAD